MIILGVGVYANTYKTNLCVCVRVPHTIGRPPPLSFSFSFFFLFIFFFLSFFPLLLKFTENIIKS